MAQYTLQYLEEKYNEDRLSNEHLNNLQLRLQADFNFFNRELQHGSTKDDSLKNYQKIYLELLDHQRTVLRQMNHHAEFDEELIRKYLALIDLEEFKIREKQLHEDVLQTPGD